MKTFQLVAFVTLAVLHQCAAGPAASPGSVLSVRDDAPECNVVECVVNLGESLPTSISACAEALKDLNETLSGEDANPTKVALQAADCIAEAALAVKDLPENCGGCLENLLGSSSDD